MMPVCRFCGKFFKSLGIARHEMMHVDKAKRERALEQKPKEEKK